MPEPKRVIIDTDPGIDDAAAIFMALASPELQIEAFTTTFGNASTDQCTINTLRLLEATGRTDIPVYKGVGKMLNYETPAYAPHVHGNDGLGNTNLPMPTTPIQSRAAVPEIIERVMASPGEITLMVIGRQTNLALAISLEPRVATAIKEVVVMGGALREPGNVNMVATANIWGDPEAADLVYQSGANIVQVGLDVCNQVEISAEQQQSFWDTGTPAAKILEDATKFINQAYKDANRLYNPGGVQYTDVSAMAYAIDPTLFECRDLYVRVETQGLFTRGQTVADLRKRPQFEPNIKVAMGVDARRVTDLWANRVTSLGFWTSSTSRLCQGGAAL